MTMGTFSHNYRPDKLLELIKQGKTAKEIMKELAISRWSLKEHLLMLQHRDKKYYEIPGLHEDEREKHPSYTREGIIFSPNMLDKTGFKPGDRFEMTVEEDKIILTKIT
ncbi:MAG: AbrB/MazE/SpoVT family DNA-binding domain-containing protein [Desulfovermiculus sp.]|nr:AbrB/MazE/SpoVT family DNA-binding domain-containing protein [Desulfovermiculus sp.]